MTEPIVSRAKIERDARAAAKVYDNINAACPYPFGTKAAREFSAEFKRARAEIQTAKGDKVAQP